MKNRIMISVYVPSLDETYDMWIPFGDRLGSITELICKMIYELTDGIFNYEQGYALIDPDTAEPYDLNKSLKDTNIRNNKKVIIWI